MNRIKNYDATGVAPNGRLYAGDLNLLQDTVAALTDLAQNLSVGSLAVGAADTTLTHYGAQEMAVSGLLRVLGVFRAASGIIVGSYTTAQRDAIVTPDYGLVILNTSTNRYEWNSGTPAAPTWTALGGGSFQQGTHALRPAASVTNANMFYLETDTNGGTLFASTGAAWVQVAAPITIPDGSITTAKFAGCPLGAGFTFEFNGPEANIPGWSVPADGRYISNAAFPLSYAAIGDTWNTFGGLAAPPAGNHRVPDHRGRGVIGKVDMGTGNGSTPAISGVKIARATTLGGLIGEEYHTLTISEHAPHDHGGATGNDSVDHTHSGTTGNDSVDHTHSGTTASETTDHTHSMGGYTLANANSSSGYGGGGGDGFPQGTSTGGRSSVHTHTYTTGGRSSNHTHTFTTGGRSVTHTHPITSQGGGSAHENVHPVVVVNKVYSVK